MSNDIGIISHMEGKTPPLIGVNSMNTLTEMLLTAQQHVDSLIAKQCAAIDAGNVQLVDYLDDVILSAENTRDILATALKKETRKNRV